MHNIKGNIAWILPPRTGTRYTIQLIKKYSEFEGRNGQHEVNIDRLGDRKLYMNIRNPYTRLQSFWRLLLRPKRQERLRPFYVNRELFDLSFEDYILNLKDVENFEKEYRWKQQYMVNEVRYPYTLCENFNDRDRKKKIPVERVDKFIRLEHFYDDLKEVGFEPDLPKVHGWGEHSIQLEWYKDHPECAEIVSRLYADDFESLGYEIIR